MIEEKKNEEKTKNTRKNDSIYLTKPIPGSLFDASYKSDYSKSLIDGTTSKTNNKKPKTKQQKGHLAGTILWIIGTVAYILSIIFAYTSKERVYGGYQSIGFGIFGLILCILGLVFCLILIFVRTGRFAYLMFATPCAILDTIIFIVKASSDVRTYGPIGLCIFTLILTTLSLFSACLLTYKYE